VSRYIVIGGRNLFRRKLELVLHYLKTCTIPSHYIFVLQEVNAPFSGLGVEQDEWVDIRQFVRQCSLPCIGQECVVVLPDDFLFFALRYDYLSLS
jgi:hypothetical protein